MKHYIYILSVVFLIASTWSCSDDMPAPPVPSGFNIQLEQNSNTVEADGATLNLTISAGANGWWITQPTDSEWCVIAKKFGSGDYTLPIKIGKNTTGKERSIAITVHPTFNLEPIDLIINQNK